MTMTFEAGTPAELGRLPVGAGITHHLQPGQRLVARADAVSNGHALEIEAQAGEPRPNTCTEIPAGEVTTLGPYATRRAFILNCDSGTLIVKVA